MKVNSVGVLGLGDFGRTVALELSKYGCDVVAIDTNEKKVQSISEEVAFAAIGDFTDVDLLRDVGIANCEIVVIATGTNLESSVLAIMQCKKLGIKQIIAKARSSTFEEVLYEVGVDAVISPERDSGIRLASKILRNKIDEVLRLDDNTSVVEFEIPQDWVGKNLIELDLRRKYDLNIVGMREERGETMTPVQPEDLLNDEILLVAIAASHIFEKYDYLEFFK